MKIEEREKGKKLGSSSLPFCFFFFLTRLLFPSLRLVPRCLQPNKPDGRYALKTALREMEGAVAGAKQLVDAQLQTSLDAARREAELARASALKAEALSGKLALIRGRVEGTEEEGGEGGEDRDSG